MPMIYTNKELPKRIELDFYPTPIEFCLAVVQKLDRDGYLDVIGNMLDPGCGTGVWGEALDLYFPERHIRKVGVELRNDTVLHDAYEVVHYNMDYLKWNPSERFDLILGNPPFGIDEDFVDKSLELLSKKGFLVFLLPTTFQESKKRYKKYYSTYDKKPVSIWQVVERIDFKKAGSGNPNSHCVFIWTRDALIPRAFTVMNWLSWR